MSTGLKLTLAEYEAMVHRGAFDRLEHKHVELLHGELRQMSPQHAPHFRYISRLNRWSMANAPVDVEVRIQGPLAIPEFDSEPEPDVAWAKQINSAERHVQPEEVYLLIEVGDSSLADDLHEKAELYALAEIADYWVVDVPNRQMHVLRDPTPHGYRQHERFRDGELRPLAFPHVSLDLTEFFGD